MSESFKYELAKDLGFYDVVQKEGWEGIRTKDAGNMVKRAIQIAEEHLVKQQSQQQNHQQQQQQVRTAPQMQTSNTNYTYRQPVANSYVNAGPAFNPNANQAFMYPPVAGTDASGGSAEYR
jgi:small acid-soluble spore protein F (minor alpha/beta-type SASP)